MLLSVENSAARGEYAVKSSCGSAIVLVTQYPLFSIIRKNEFHTLSQAEYNTLIARDDCAAYRVYSGKEASG